MTVREITRFSFATESEEAKIKSLLVLSGVSYPVASVILHFAFPDRYPMLDFRVLWSLGLEQPTYYTFDFWEKYRNEIKGITRRIDETIRTVDKALWEYSKEHQKNQS